MAWRVGLEILNFAHTFPALDGERARAAAHRQPPLDARIPFVGQRVAARSTMPRRHSSSARAEPDARRRVRGGARPRDQDEELAALAEAVRDAHGEAENGARERTWADIGVLTATQHRRVRGRHAHGGGIPWRSWACPAAAPDGGGRDRGDARAAPRRHGQCGAHDPAHGRAGRSGRATEVLKERASEISPDAGVAPRAPRSTASSPRSRTASTPS